MMIEASSHAISQNRLARAMCVSPRRVNEIVHRKRAVSADTAIRLAQMVPVLPYLSF